MNIHWVTQEEKEKLFSSDETALAHIRAYKKVGDWHFMAAQALTGAADWEPADDEFCPEFNR